MYQNDAQNNFEQRFSLFKKFVEKNEFKFSPFWEKAKKTFDVDLKNGNYYSSGERNYLPFIHNYHKYDKNKLIKIFDSYFIKIGCKNLCTTTNAGNSSLLHTIHYYKLLENYFIKNIVTCEVGAGSGLLQFILHHFKNSKSIIIDIPEVMLNSIALCFSLFPNAKVILPNEISTDKLDIHDYDFIFLLPSQKYLIEKNSIDFCFNTQSFMEMKKSEINEYIKLFDHILKEKGFCFISNRVLKYSYFFSYNFKNTHFKKIFFKQDDYYNKKKMSLLNLLLEKNFTNFFYFSLYDYFTGILYLKKNEHLFWLKIFFKAIVKKPIKFITNKLNS